MYSFRPEDAEKTWPQIAITPASFEAIRSMDDMLNLVPYIVVKEYFFKNTASTMADFIQKIMGMAKNAFESAKEDTSTKEASSQGSGDAKSTGTSLLDKIKNAFSDIDPKVSVIDIPYTLYAGLRQRQYGNIYIFPYIATSSTVINEASNTAEWNGENEGLISKLLKGFVSSVAQGIGGAARLATGS